MYNITVSDHFLAYFDVLGYKTLISKMGENEYLNALSKAIDDTYAGLSKHNHLLALAGMSLDIKNDNINIDVFSDNAILSLTCGDNEVTTIAALVRLLTFMAELQTRLACEHGIFVRGALVKGTFYRDSRFLGGKGLIKVYALESSLAIYPRVVIDKGCYDWLVQKIVTLDEASPIRGYMTYLINNFMFLADDGLISIHHLNVQNWALLKGITTEVRAVFSAELQDVLEHFNFEAEQNHQTQNLLRYGEKVIDNLRENDGKGWSSVLQKYLWAANYYNATCALLDMPDKQITQGTGLKINYLDINIDSV